MVGFCFWGKVFDDISSDHVLTQPFRILCPIERATHVIVSLQESQLRLSEYGFECWGNDLLRREHYLSPTSCGHLGRVSNKGRLVDGESTCVQYDGPWKPNADDCLQCAIVGGAITGQILSAVCIKWLSRWVSLKWQLVATVVIFTAFIGGQAKISADDRARPTAFSFISSTMIGLMEVLTMAGAPLMIPAEDLGLANGIEFTIRGILSCVSGE